MELHHPPTFRSKSKRLIWRVSLEGVGAGLWDVSGIRQRALTKSSYEDRVCDTEAETNAPIRREAPGLAFKVLMRELLVAVVPTSPRTRRYGCKTWRTSFVPTGAPLDARPGGSQTVPVSQDSARRGPRRSWENSVGTY